MQGLDPAGGEKSCRDGFDAGNILIAAAQHFSIVIVYEKADSQYAYKPFESLLALHLVLAAQMRFKVFQ